MYIYGVLYCCIIIDTCNDRLWMEDSDSPMKSSSAASAAQATKEAAQRTAQLYENNALANPTPVTAANANTTVQCPHCLRKVIRAELDDHFKRLCPVRKDTCVYVSALRSPILCCYDLLSCYICLNLNIPSCHLGMAVALKYL